MSVLKELQSPPTTSSTTISVERMKDNTVKVFFENFKDSLSTKAEVSLNKHLGWLKDNEIFTEYLEENRGYSAPLTHELSDILISPTGIHEEPAFNTEIIYSQIVEVNEKYVTLECLMNISKRIYKERKVKRPVLEGIVPLQGGQQVIITITDRKGGSYIKYENGKNITPSEYFDTSHLFGNEEDYVNEPAK